MLVQSQGHKPQKGTSISLSSSSACSHLWSMPQRRLPKSFFIFLGLLSSDARYRAQFKKLNEPDGSISRARIQRAPCHRTSTLFKINFKLFKKKREYFFLLAEGLENQVHLPEKGKKCESLAVMSS